MILARLSEYSITEKIQSLCENEIKRRGIDSISAQDLLDYAMTRSKGFYNIKNIRNHTG